MLTSLVYLQQENAEKFKYWIKTVNIDKENLYTFRTTWGTSMQFSGKMWVIIILEILKNQSFTLSLGNTVLVLTFLGLVLTHPQFGHRLSSK